MPRTLRALAVLATVIALAAAPVALAAKGAADDSFMRAASRMEQSMRAPMVGDADQDFASMMRAHHQGAIDMAKVELQYGTDPQLRAMAQGIIDAQTKEIGELDAWLKARGHGP